MATGLAGKSVIVTGAASGFGLATARRFVREGASVVMADIDEDRLQKEVENLSSEGFDGQALGFHGDLREKLTMSNLMAFSVDAFDNVHVLVNAVCLIASGDPLDPATDHFEETFVQNVVTTLRMSQIAARRMIEYSTDEKPEPADRCILNLSSVLARRSIPEFLSFSVSSAAVEQTTRCLANALSPHRIRVNAIAVGGMMGPSADASMPGLDDVQEALRQVTPLGQPDGYRDAAQAAVFLASPASSFTTGQILAVDGGRLLVDPLDQVTA